MVSNLPPSDESELERSIILNIFSSIGRCRFLEEKHFVVYCCGEINYQMVIQSILYLIAIKSVIYYSCVLKDTFVLILSSTFAVVASLSFDTAHNTVRAPLRTRASP